MSDVGSKGAIDIERTQYGLACWSRWQRRSLMTVLFLEEDTGGRNLYILKTSLLEFGNCFILGRGHWRPEFVYLEDVFVGV